MAEFSLIEAIILGVGWPLTIILSGFLIMVMIFTPAKTFLKAKFGKKSIFHTVYRNSMGKFLLGKPTGDGWAHLDNGQEVDMTEGSAIFDQKTKVPIFQQFGELAPTIPREYPAILQELREAGFSINNYSDYKKYVDLAHTDESKLQEHLNKIEDPQQRKKVEKALKNLKENVSQKEVQIKPWKTYKMHQLGHMFPNNISPSNVSAKVTNTETRVRKKTQRQEQLTKLLIYGAVTIFILALAAGIIFKFIKSGDCPPCECQVVKTGLETAKNASGIAA